MSKQILGVQQMQHLQELGLELKPSLLHYYKVISEDNVKWYLSLTIGDILDCSPRYRYIPAYTLQDIIELLPSLIRIKDVDYWLEMGKSNLPDEKDAYYVMYVDFKYNMLVYFGSRESHSLIDEVYEMLCWCVENGHVETDKNK